MILYSLIKHKTYIGLTWVPLIEAVKEMDLPIQKKKKLTFFKTPLTFEASKKNESIPFKKSWP